MVKINPKVSIIILNWNGKHFLDGCLRSLQKQTYSDFEIVLIDNGSTDGSPDYVEAEFPEVILRKLPKNIGYCAGNNLGFSLAKGEYIVFLNNDTVCETNWLEELVKEIESREDIGFCVPKICFLDDKNTIDAAGDAYTIAGTAYSIGHGKKDSAELDIPYELMVAGGVSPMFRKKVLNEVGLFDEDFYTGSEDIDLSLRVTLRGYTGLYVPSSKIFHKRRGSQSKDLKKSAYYNLINIERVWVKNMPWQLMLKYLPQKLFFTLGSLIYFTYKGYGLIFLKAKLKFLLSLPKVLKKRHQIQKSKKINHRTFDKYLGKRWVSIKFNRVKELLKGREVWSS